HIFKCFGGSAKRDIVGFVQQMEAREGREVTRRDAALLLQEWCGLESPRDGDDKPRGKVPQKAAPTDGQKGRKQEPVQGQADDAPAHPAPAAPVINPPLEWKLENLDAEHPYLRK